jgi:hypothetical protein
MAKGKSSGKTSYTSSGVHSNVSSKITNILRSEYLRSGDRVLNQLAAFRAGKRVMITIENPNKDDKSKRFIRVEASTVWKKLPKVNMSGPV